jgi:hypothetical protein
MIQILVFTRHMGATYIWLRAWCEQQSKHRAQETLGRCEWRLVVVALSGQLGMAARVHVGAIHTINTQAAYIGA